MELKCDYCPKLFSSKRNLARHLDRMTGKDGHPAKETDVKPTVPTIPVSEPPVTPLPPTTTLKIKAPVKAKTEGDTYHCVACGEDVKKDESPCLACGARLDWEALNARN
jgi:hypothetical protein